MRRDIINSVIAIVALTLLFGVVYPLAMTGISQLAFHSAANGSLIKRNGHVVGSKLIAQAFQTGSGDKATADPAYFQPRPSQTSYAANASGFSNLGPNQKKLADQLKVNLASYLTLEQPYDTSLTKATVPVDAVTTSASGLDPDISQANARIQAYRIAQTRHTTYANIARLVNKHTDGRALGVFGEPAVNVLELNLDLNKEYPVR